jgi:hypothetical protein
LSFDFVADKILDAGFHFIPQALSVEEQFFWIRESLTSFTQPPNRTNHNTLYGPISDLWAHVQERHVFVEDDSNPDGTLSQEEVREPCPDGVADEPLNDSEIAAGSMGLTAKAIPYSVQQLKSEQNNEILLHDGHISPDAISNVLTPRLVHEKLEESSKNWRFVDEAKVSSGCSRTQASKISAESLLRKLRWATIGQQFDWTKVRG